MYIYMYICIYSYICLYDYSNITSLQNYIIYLFIYICICICICICMYVSIYLSNLSIYIYITKKMGDLKRFWFGRPEKFKILFQFFQKSCFVFSFLYSSFYCFTMRSSTIISRIFLLFAFFIFSLFQYGMTILLYSLVQ